MEKEFVSYEQAVALKELGFNEPCLDFYDNDKELFYNSDNKDKIHIGNGVNAPLKQQVFSWFREKGYAFNIMADNAILNGNYFYDIWYNETDYDYSTYEKAENDCIDKLIEIAKQQSNTDGTLSKQQDNGKDIHQD